MRGQRGDLLGFLIGYINLSLVRIFRNKIDLYLTHIVKTTAVAVREEDDEHENEFDTDSEQEKRFQPPDSFQNNQLATKRHMFL